MKKLLSYLAIPAAVVGIIAATWAVLGPQKADAQQTAKVVAACGAQSYTAGSFQYLLMDVTGDACSSGTGGGGNVVITPAAAANGCSLALKATATACGTAAGHTVSTLFVGNFSNNNEQCLELFDLATGSVTVGTTTPTKFWDVAGGWAGNINLPAGGLVFSTGVTIAVVKVASCAWSGATSSDVNNIVVTTTGPN